MPGRAKSPLKLYPVISPVIEGRRSASIVLKSYGTPSLTYYKQLSKMSNNKIIKQ